MSGFLVTDTNSAIKLAFLKDKFFKPGFVSSGQAVLYRNVVRIEVVGHISKGYKKRIDEHLVYLRDCSHYKEYEIDDFEFTTYEIEFENKKEEIVNNSGYVGTNSNDEKLLFLAITNNQTLVTNEYALTHLAKAMGHPVCCAEDLALQAYDEGKLSLIELQALVNDWNAKGERVMSDKVEAFRKRKINF